MKNHENTKQNSVAKKRKNEMTHDCSRLDV